MYSPRKFASRVGRIGKPLPDPFSVFGFEQVTFRRGATSLLAGKPGSFKSVLALNMLVSWSRAGCAVQYFSADSDEFTVCKRLSSILTGDSADAVDGRMKDPKYAQALAELGTETGFEYRHGYMEDIADAVESWEAFYGAYPDVVFIDNLRNYADTAGDWLSMMEMIKQLNIMALERKLHVVILHHARVEAPRKDDRPLQPPRDDQIEGKLTQIPRLVLTTAAVDKALNVACVKNTNGPSFPDASHYMQFYVNGCMRTEEHLVLA